MIVKNCFPPKQPYHKFKFLNPTPPPLFLFFSNCIERDSNTKLSLTKKIDLYFALK